MKDDHRFRIAASLIFLFLFASLPLLAQEAPAPEVDESVPPEPAAKETLLVADAQNAYELSLPSADWEAVRPEEIISGYPACGGKPKLPASLLLLLRDKEAQLKAAKLERMPEIFLMRNRDDLEKYVSGWKDALKSQGEEAIRFLESSYSEREGMIMHRLLFEHSSPPGGGGCAGKRTEAKTISYLMVDFFVRPQAEDARLYRLTFLAPADAYAAAAPEFERLAESFRFTGKTAEEFFAPDAPEEKFPAAPTLGTPAPGTRSGSSFLILALVAVVLVYLLSRRRSKPPELSP